ncbi:hypothetical protein N0V86_004414 [Didymella sp. IMI 355093]|nr:hypothetical protein N0V86_004414 [Didymella sp. IMI 355093]
MTSTDTSFLAERADGTLAYKATESDHLGRMFEILRMYPEVALRITSLTLDEVFHGPHHSDILDFAEDYGSEPDMGPLGEEDYETMSEDGVETREELGYMEDNDCEVWEDTHEPWAF